jgi:hypothetical protein
MCGVGARWDSNWRTTRGCSLLHLFLAAFPPARDDTNVYRSLLKDAIERGGLSTSAEDDQGRNPLFVFCEQLASTPNEQCPDANRLVYLLLDSATTGRNGGSAAVGGSDRTGRTVFDIADKVASSCLASCRQILLDAGKVGGGGRGGTSSGSSGYGAGGGPGGAARYTSSGGIVGTGSGASSSSSSYGGGSRPSNGNSDYGNGSNNTSSTHYGSSRGGTGVGNGSGVGNNNLYDSGYNQPLYTSKRGVGLRSYDLDS